MRACGIDLGTTNSCIYVVDGSSHRLIIDEHENSVFPSVVFVGSDGKVVVGQAGKNRMGELPGPVVTIKRKMGSTDEVLLGGEKKSPIEVSALILSYLKQLGERQVGDVIDRAVVTVPAYFNHIQRQQTDEAGKQAGFREVITLLEPVAAALAYSLSSDKEKLRVFVYDLGGGTFDATVLEKDSYGGITVLSFGGDPFLGGDDVDSRLAGLLLKRLQEKGYSLDLDLETPADFSRFQRLKFYAEFAKKELSTQGAVTLTRQGLFEDKAGDTVDLDMPVTRQELEDCVRDLILRSINESLDTLRKKEIAPETIDEIIMVGGMSRMPLVQQMLAEAFNREPKVVDPDLIVARGAVIKASEVFGEQEVAESGLRLELRYDRRTNKDRVQIGGLFDRPVRAHTIYLTNDSLELSQRLDGTDRFSFENVALLPGRDNVFALSVEDGDQPIIEREIVISQDAEASQVLVSPGSVVTKPIAVWTVDGLEVFFPENTMLPHTVSHTFETADQSGRIIAPIWEGNHEVSRLEIHDIPTDLKLGTPVVIEVCIESNYKIKASAHVADIQRKVSIEFQIEPVDTSGVTPDFVRGQLQELDRQAQEAIADCPSDEAVMIFKIRYQAVKDQIEIELSEIEPKRAKLQEKLREMAALIQNLPSKQEHIELRPTFEEFSNRLTETITEAIESNHSNLPSVRPQIDILREQARKAWASKDPIAWCRVNDQLAAVEGILAPEVYPTEKALGLAAFIIANQIPELEAAARGRYSYEIQGIQSAAMDIFMKVQVGAMEPREAIGRIIALYQDKVVVLRQKLGLASEKAPMVVPSSAIEGDGSIRKQKTA